MSEPNTTTTNVPDKPALVLHVNGTSEPLLFALSTEVYEQLGTRLPAMVRAADVETITTKNGAEVTINFMHVAAAYLDDLQRGRKPFGLR